MTVTVFPSRYRREEKAFEYLGRARKKGISSIATAFLFRSVLLQGQGEPP